MLSLWSLTTRTESIWALGATPSPSLSWPRPGAAGRGLGGEALPEASRGRLSVLNPQSFPTDPGHGDEKQQAFAGLFVHCLGHIKIFFKIFFLVVFTLFQVIFVDVKCVYDVYGF